MRHCAKARNLKGMGSRAGAKVGERNGGGGRARSRDGSHEHRIGDGRVKAGRRRRRG